MEQVNGKSCRFLSREHPGFSLSCDLVVTVIIVQSLDLVDLGSTDAIDTAFAVGIGGVSDIKHFPKVCFSAAFAGALCLKQHEMNAKTSMPKKGVVVCWECLGDFFVRNSLDFCRLATCRSWSSGSNELPDPIC